MTEPRIGWACITMNRLDELRVVVNRMAPYVDKMIVIDGGSTDDTVHYLRGRGDVHYRIYPWPDNFSRQRTHYIEEARALKLDWLFVSDTDEWYSEDTARNLRTIAGLWEERGWGAMELRCEAVTMCGEKEAARIKADGAHSFHKLLGFKITPGLHYEGNPHEGLMWGPGEMLPVMKAPERFFYEHVKQLGVVAARGARNFYIGGGGDNEQVPKWYWFRQLVNDCHAKGIAHDVEAHRGVPGKGNFPLFVPQCRGCFDAVPWPTFDRLLVRGEIYERIQRWILDHRHDAERGGDSEVREMYLYFFRILHPELDPNPAEHIAGQECSLP